MPVVRGADGLYHRVSIAEADFPIKGTPTPDAAAEMYFAPPEPVEPKAELAECSNCPMARRPACTPERVRKVDVVFVGEGPGSNEVTQQEFFVGRAGQLLNAGISQTGLGDCEYIFNNATLCLPDSSFPPDALWRCRGRLLKELAACEPKVIVAVGAQALSSLLGQVHGITEVQGLVMDYALPHTEVSERLVKLVPCFHSAYVLRNPSAFYDFMNALVKARMVLDDDPLADVQPERFERCIATEEDTLELLERVVAYPNIYADLETTGFDPYHDAIICISLAGRPEGASIVELGCTFDWGLFEKNSKALGLLIKTLERRKVDYWNGFFDCQFLREYGIDAKVGGDIMLKQYTLDERPMSQGLKSTARKVLNAPNWEAPLREYLPNKEASYATIPFDVLAKYATLDACYTGTLDPALSRMMEPNNQEVYERILVPATNMFVDVVGQGLLVDTTQLESLHEELSIKLQELLEKLQDSLGDEGFNPSSTNDAKFLCYDVLGLKGNGSTQREVIEPYRSQYEEVGWLLDFRSTRKMINTYIEGIQYELDENNRWHPNIRVNGTVTGRLASGKGKGERSRKAVNALGVPKEKGGIKRLVVAPEGRLMLEGDGAQMELRVLAALSKDKHMIADFRRGRDFHGIIRDRMFGRGPGKENYNHQEVLDAKTVAFGPPYGRTAESVAMEIHSTVQEAKDFLEMIWGEYPDALQWLEDRVQELKETGEVRSYYGRVRHWGLITPDTIEAASKEARNFGVQSAATDTNLLIMIGIYETMDHDLILPLLPTHDAILNSISKARRDEARKAFKKYAEHRAQELLNTDMPFVYDIGVGKSWGELEE